MSLRRRATASSRRRGAAAAALMVGQYMGWDQSSAITTWESANGISIPLGHEFGDKAQWSFFDTGTNFANWETWVNAKAGRRFSYSAPLLTANDDTGLTIPQKYVQLAAGTYDSHFTSLGAAFQARPALRNSIVRLGWEFNGQVWPWSVPPNDQTTLDNYKTGFNRAAAALKAACPTLEIEWCPNCQMDYTNRTFADMYPGNTYIDYIGIGLYDYYWPGGTPTQAQREAFLRDNPNGLADQVALAAATGKRLAHTEWGLWTASTTVGEAGGGDRPAFIDFIADWYAANNYAYSVYNNISATAEHRLDLYPNAKARYLARFGGAATAPTVAPTPIAFAEGANQLGVTPRTVGPVTVAVGDVLVLTGVTSDSAATLSTPTGGTGFTWTLRQNVTTASHAGAYTWTATATQAQTVTFSVARATGTKNFAVYLKVWRGSAGIGATAKGNSTASGAASLALTTTAPNSAIDVTVADWSNTATTPTWRTTAGAFTQQAFHPVGDAAGNYTSATGYHGNAGAAGAKTVGLTAPSYDWSITAVEILGK